MPLTVNLAHERRLTSFRAMSNLGVIQSDKISHINLIEIHKYMKIEMWLAS